MDLKSLMKLAIEFKKLSEIEEVPETLRSVVRDDLPSPKNPSNFVLPPLEEDYKVPENKNQNITPEIKDGWEKRFNRLMSLKKQLIDKRLNSNEMELLERKYDMGIERLFDAVEIDSEESINKFHPGWKRNDFVLLLNALGYMVAPVFPSRNPWLKNEPR